MNFTPAEIEKKSTEYARTLLEYARANEPQITADLQKIAEENSAEMVGLEHKFKAEESLAEKILYQATKIFENLSEEELLEETFSELIERQNDALRYTFVLPFEKYVFGFRSSLEKLKQKGYQVPENKIWNAWKNIGTKFDKGYRGINITLISSQQQIFELQFHTEASFQLKIETHKIYKEIRKTSRRRKAEIAKMMLDLAAEIAIPQGVKKL